MSIKFSLRRTFFFFQLEMQRSFNLLDACRPGILQIPWEKSLVPGSQTQGGCHKWGSSCEICITLVASLLGCTEKLCDRAAAGRE